MRPAIDLPSWVDLGLSRSSAGDINMYLLDPAGGKVYRTLSHKSRRLFRRCLCTPMWLAQQGLRIGETRLLQATFPELPETLDFIDVDLINLAPFVHVPVTPIGQVPTAPHPTDLARPQAPRVLPWHSRYSGTGRSRAGCRASRSTG